MVDLKLVGLNPDGERLTLSAPSGEQFTLPVTDELRAAVRRDRPLMEQIRAAEQPVRPRDIQTMLRAGSTLQEVADLAGLPVEHIQRYESPVVAERTWVIQQARGFPVGHSSDSPALGDMVVNRLATRKIDEDQLVWSATRTGTQPWELTVAFPVGGREVEARWEVDLAGRTVHAVDDESRWLSETDMSSPRARRHPTPLPFPPDRESRVYNIEDDGDLTEQEPTDAILAQLHTSRGVRQHLDEADEDILSQFLDSPDTDVPPAHPPVSDPESATDARVLPLPTRHVDQPPAAVAAPEVPAATAERRPRRSSRRSVPSWDEIVFGSRME